MQSQKKIIKNQKGSDTNLLHESENTKKESGTKAFASMNPTFESNLLSYADDDGSSINFQSVHSTLSCLRKNIVRKGPLDQWSNTNSIIMEKVHESTIDLNRIWHSST